MVPHGRTTTTTTSRKKTSRRRTTTTKPTRKHFKKQHPQSKKLETFSANSSSTSSKDSEVAEVSTTSICSTPKGQKFKIPEISTCPPAPKKPRVLSNCSLRRSPLAFFAPPDLEVFFCVALRDVPVPFVHV